MDKNKIYQIALFYQQKIATLELNLSDTRYFRDTFKPYVDLGIAIQIDINTIADNNELSEEKKKQELKTLSDEKVKIEPLSETLFERIEKANIKITAQDLSILE